MSGGTIRRSISQEVDHVRVCIEMCLQMYMKKREIVNLLSTHDFNIQPVVTRIVWAKLEEDNPQFFRAYYVSLAVKDQILEFNRLLSMQAELMCQRGSLAGNSNYVFNSNQFHTTQQTSTPELNNNVPSTEAILHQNSHLVWNQPHMNFGGTNNLLESNPVMEDHEYASTMQNLGSSHNNVQLLDEHRLNYGLLEHSQQGRAHEYYPMESSSSNRQHQHLDELLLRDVFWEQNLPVSLSSTGNGEQLEAAVSYGSLRNPLMDLDV